MPTQAGASRLDVQIIIYLFTGYKPLKKKNVESILFYRFDNNKENNIFSRTKL